MLGLPSLHTLDHAQGARIWFAAEATDMRCGFDRLAERVRAVIGQDNAQNADQAAPSLRNWAKERIDLIFYSRNPRRSSTELIY
jgi:hypothetical protein